MEEGAEEGSREAGRAEQTVGVHWNLFCKERAKWKIQESWGFKI